MTMCTAFVDDLVLLFGTQNREVHSDLSREPYSTEDNWWYIDAQGQVQGPFACHVICGWTAMGCFPMDTLVRRHQVRHTSLLGKSHTLVVQPLGGVVSSFRVTCRVHPECSIPGPSPFHPRFIPVPPPFCLSHGCWQEVNVYPRQLDAHDPINKSCPIHASHSSHSWVSHTSCTSCESSSMGQVW